MANKSKQKGNRFEREIVDIFAKANLPSKRAWGSNGQAIGQHEEVDVLIDIGHGIKVQCKVRKNLPKWIIPSEHVDIQLIKEDRGKPYVVLPLNEYIRLLRK